MIMKKPTFKLIKKFRSWWLGGRSITRSLFRVAAAWQGIAIVGVILTVAYVMAAFYTQSGEFIISVNHPGEKSLVLCDTEDFKNPLLVLKGETIENADNISIYDIEPNLKDMDGMLNGPDYIAYSFYLKNIGDTPVTYNYFLTIQKMTKGIENAVWVILYHNGKQQVFAAPSKDGTPECQYSEYEFPFMKDALHPEQMTFDKKKGLYRLETIPFAATKLVTTAKRDEIQPGEIDKFTVIIWLEGEDPECINDILGGTIEMMMKFKY